MTTLAELQLRVRDFARARDWEQFHSPKNLAMALAGEVGEINALLQWVESENVTEWLADSSNADALRLELADVLTYLLLLADSVGVDPVEAGAEKLALNEQRYPVKDSRGRATKYTSLLDD